MAKPPPATQIKRAAGLSFQGLKVPAIAQALNVSSRTIINWKKTKIWKSEIEAWEALERREIFEITRDSFDCLAGELISLRRMLTGGLRVQIQAGTALGVAALAAIEKLQTEHDDPVDVMEQIQKIGCGYGLQSAGQALKVSKEILNESYAIGAVSNQLSQFLGSVQEAQTQQQQRCSTNSQEETNGQG